MKSHRVTLRRDVAGWTTRRQGAGFWTQGRARTRGWLLLVVALCGLAGTARAQEPLLYVPYVDATTGTLTQDDGRILGEGWLSSLTLFNNGSASASWRWVAAYGGGVHLGDADPYCLTSTAHDVPPGTGTTVGSCLPDRPSGGVAILVLGVSGQIIPSSTVSRIHTLADCNEPGVLIIPQGRVPAPAFTSPFPAGSVVVSGDIDLGDPGFASCVSSNQRYPRRVNVTMFNSGDMPASFQISVRAGVNSSSTYYQQPVSVPAKEIVQVNSLPLSLDDVAVQPGTAATGGTIVWILITADQPFLSYVSTIFDNPEPGALPFEVYPSQLQN